MLWALLTATLMLQPDTCAASRQSESILRAMTAAAKPTKDYSFNMDDVYASPATMEKYMNSYSFPGPVDYVSAATMPSDGGGFEFYPTLTSGSVFDNFAFSPTIKLDELAAYQEPTGHVVKHSIRNKGKKVWRLKGDDDDVDEFGEGGTRHTTTKNGGKVEEWRRPDAKRNSEESRSVEEEGAAAAAGRRRRPNGSSGSYFRGVPEQDEDSSEEEGGGDTPREDERAETSPATSLSDRDEIAYSRSNSRRPFVRVKNSGALTSEEASSSEEGRRGAAAPLRNYETGPRNNGNGDVRGSTTTTTANQRFENGRRRNVANGGYGNSGELPSFTAETSGSRPEGAPRVRGGNGNTDDVRDVRYNSYNGNDIDSALRTASGAALRDTFAATLTTTTERPEVGNGLILLNGNGRLGGPQLPARDTSTSGGRAAKSRRRPPLAYTPGSMEYQSEQDDEGSGSREQEETTTNGYSTTTTVEPIRYSSEEETAPPREESRYSAEDRLHAMMRPTQTANRMKRPVSAELGAAAATTPLNNGRTAATVNGQRSVNNGRKRGGGGYAAPEPPAALPPASSLVFLTQDPTPSLDQKAAATVTTGADQRTAATTGAGGRPRTLFHQQGFQGPYSYRFGFDTADPYNPQTRYEEKDADGRVRGSYSYLDPKGRLQVVRYEADPQGGFRVKGSFGQFPGDKKP
ncbi:uncharacterized protein LOC119461287 [Dermacentor silvarum]|uniref:uncharacterized protein LOC119461287 n=1 Tax=Dermacentor silvarum TaxID=543639 RepID=UPI00189B1D5C|nr:uncharacterized protein LOC119461287 [Dermacentor silvarum]